MSRNRIKSAGPIVDPQDEIRVLRNSVTQLQQELMQSKFETQKTAEQLNCLILLVKRAWTGDKSAAVNVANIVGVAPPDYEVESSFFITTLQSKPKNRAVNNWAVLTIGLLNREYKELENQQAFRGNLYLQERQDYLDRQLLYSRDQQIRQQMLHKQKEEDEINELKRFTNSDCLESTTTKSSINSYSSVSKPPSGAMSGVYNVNNRNDSNAPHVPLQRTNSLTDLRKTQSASFSENLVGNKMGNQENQAANRPKSCKTRAPVKKHLYRPASEKAESESTSLTWADLIIAPNSRVEQHNHENLVFQDTSHAPPKTEDCKSDTAFVNSRGMVRKKPKPKVQRFDDPQRYNVNGLYDADSVLGAVSGGNIRKRPLSAKQQRDADNMRARPKSAVYGKSESLVNTKTYTRPASATTIASKLKYTQRPPSGTNNPARKQQLQDIIIQNSATTNNSNLHSKTAFTGKGPSSGGDNGSRTFSNQTNNNHQDLSTAATKDRNSSNGRHNQNGVVPPLRINGVHDFSRGFLDDLDHSYDSVRDYYDDDNVNDLVYDEKAFEKMGIDLKEIDRELKQAQAIKVDIKKPKSVIAFEEDVKSMKAMEKIIKKNAMELQKKIGLCEDGII